MTIQQIIDWFLQGTINKEEAQNLIGKVWTENKTPAAQMNSEVNQWMQVVRANPVNEKGVVRTPKTAKGAAQFEIETDPLTAYLQRAGIGGKTVYNPAEQYQVGLYDPFKSLYDIQSRLGRPGAALQDAGTPISTLADYMGAIPGGLGGVVKGARQQLGSIFGATPTQKASVGVTGLDYEPMKYLPGEGGEADTMNPGSLAELRKLFEYGLRPTAGIQGARYAAQSLPRAQQAYYSQKTAGQPGATDTNFLDWLKANWQGLNF